MLELSTHSTPSGKGSALMAQSNMNTSLTFVVLVCSISNLRLINRDRVAEMAPRIENDIRKHQRATLDSMQAYLAEQIFSLEDITAKLDELRNAAGLVAARNEIKARLEDL
jgi:tRNA isopentenyl-2-thiomethyl-A-37 hydroxylase MiaE